MHLNVTSNSPETTVQLGWMRGEIEKQQSFKLLKDVYGGKMRYVWERIDPDGVYRQKDTPIEMSDLVASFLLAFEKGDWENRDETMIVYPTPENIRTYRRSPELSEAKKLSPKRARKLLGFDMRYLYERHQLKDSIQKSSGY